MQIQNRLRRLPGPCTNGSKSTSITRLRRRGKPLCKMGNLITLYFNVFYTRNCNYLLRRLVDSIVETVITSFF